jgi:predicted MFS family arabinose efflux permease
MQTPTAVPPASPKSAADLIVAYFRDFGVLKETRKEYWGIQIINFLDCTFYFAMLTVASLFLSHDLGMSDVAAGNTIMWFTAAVTLLLTLSGMLTDWLGIRNSLRISMVSMLLLRLCMVAVGLMPSLPHRGTLAMVLLVLMAPFMAGIQTIFQAATQRYTTRRSRSAGFNLWYLFMNIGAAAGGYAIDFVRLDLKVRNVHIFTMGVVTAFLCLVCGELLVRREDQLRGADEGPEAPRDKPQRRSPLETFLDLVRQPAFFRLLVLIALVLGVRAVYTYFYLLMPKYWERTIGADAAIGKLNMINPIGIVIGLILFIPFANKFKVFNLLLFGAMVSALSLFPLALPWQWYGSDIGRAHYEMAILCMIIVTIGEVFWSPKLNEYTAAIAPKGQEGTYLGFSMLPWFAAKLIVSKLSGHMLTRWSPESVAIPAAKVAAEATRLGFNAQKLADNLNPVEVADQARSVGANLADAAQGLDMNAITAHAQQLGVNVSEFLHHFSPSTFKASLTGYGTNPDQLAANVDLPALALKLKVISLEASQNILAGHSGHDPVAVNLQFAMVNKWVDYWHSPAAMWFWLGVWALGGCLIAALLRGWLTYGAHWDAHSHAQAPSGAKTPSASKTNLPAKSRRLRTED